MIKNESTIRARFKMNRITIRFSWNSLNTVMATFDLNDVKGKRTTLDLRRVQ